MTEQLNISFSCSTSDLSTLSAWRSNSEGSSNFYVYNPLHWTNYIKLTRDYVYVEKKIIEKKKNPTGGPLWMEIWTFVMHRPAQWKTG